MVLQYMAVLISKSALRIGSFRLTFFLLMGKFGTSKLSLFWVANFPSSAHFHFHFIFIFIFLLHVLRLYAILWVNYDRLERL